MSENDKKSFYGPRMVKKAQAIDDLCGTCNDCIYSELHEMRSSRWKDYTGDDGITYGRGLLPTDEWYNYYVCIKYPRNEKVSANHYCSKFSLKEESER